MELDLEMPAPTADDPLATEKAKILEDRGLTLRCGRPGGDKHKWLDKALETARILELNETECYFLEDDERGVLSTRNEMAALNMIRSLLKGRDFDLENMVSQKLDNFSSREENVDNVAMPCTGKAEQSLFEWATNQGVKSNIFIADFEGYGRGGAAAFDLKAGDLVLEIPSDIIISEDVAQESEMGETLSKCVDVGREVVTLLWSIAERSNRQSKYAPYFASLPEFFHTGLSFGLEGLQKLEGSMAFEQIMRAKEHLREQYDNIFPLLCDNYPNLFPKDLYSWENFLWASELWYSNSVKVRFPDGKTRTCLIPMLGLLNHSATPHVTHYSKIDATSKTLKIFTLRSCKSGAQCFLSYGALPNIDLLCFYGFVLDNNPYDTIPVELESPDSPSKVALAERYNIGNSHLVRAPWLSNSTLANGGLPTKLLAALRIALMDESQAQNFARNPRHDKVDVENEIMVIETIVSALEALSPNLSCTDEEHASSAWDVSLAAKFLHSQRKLFTSLIEPLRRNLC